MKGSINGRIVDGERPVELSATDRGLLYGDGLFETLRVQDGRIEFLSGHLARLLQSVRELAIPFRWDEERTSAALTDVVAANGSGNLALRITVTRGSGGERLATEGCERATVVITATSLTDRSAQPPDDGFHLAICSFPRNERSPLTRHKTLNCLESILARSAARRAGADEALFLNTAGRVAEAAAANLFLVFRDALATPPIDEGALPGIVRGAVIQAAGELDLPVQERRIDPGEMFDAEGIFLTNSLLRLATVTRIDHRPVPVDTVWIPRLRGRVLELAREGTP